MRNKKSVLMTLNHNCGCFSGVGSGIAGNGICIKEGGTTNPPSMRYRSLPLSFNAMLAVCVGIERSGLLLVAAVISWARLIKR